MLALPLCVLTPAGQDRVRQLARRALQGARAAAETSRLLPCRSGLGRPADGPLVLLPCLTAQKSPLECSLKRRPMTAAPSTKGRPAFLEGGGLSGVPLDATPSPAPANHRSCSVAPGPLLCGPYGLASFHRLCLCRPCQAWPEEPLGDLEGAHQVTPCPSC